MTDWNDTFVDEGAEGVREQLREQLTPKPETDDSAPVKKQKDEDWESKLLMGRDGYKSTLRNILLILRNSEAWEGVLGYCDFSYQLVKLKRPPGGVGTGEWLAIDSLHLKDWLGREYGITPSKDEILDAVLVLAKENSFHPIRDYFAGLKWDGVDRLDTWLRDALGADGEDEYLSAAGRKFLIGAVARIMRPPVKMDNVLILEGNQGRGKSTLVRILFGENWYSETGFDIGSKDGYQYLSGIWGVELPELDAFNKAESTAAKSFFTTLKDRYRPPYGRTMEEFPRQCVFIGTTNQDEYLKDYSGNRRYWPVKCNKIEIDIIARDRDQLWAEALALFDQGSPWWIDADTPEALLFQEHQDRRMLDDPWESLIFDWVDSSERRGMAYFTSAEILIGACGRDAGHIQRADQNRIAPLMKFLGWKSERIRIKETGQTVARQTRVYKRPPPVKAMPEVDV